MPRLKNHPHTISHSAIGSWYRGGWSVFPDLLASCGVHRKYIGEAVREVHHPVYFNRVLFNILAPGVGPGVENPGGFQLRDVGKSDLVDACISLAVHITMGVRPVVLLGKQRLDAECATEQCNGALRHRETKLS